MKHVSNYQPKQLETNHHLLFSTCVIFSHNNSVHSKLYGRFLLNAITFISKITEKSLVDFFFVNQRLSLKMTQFGMAH